MGYKSLFLWIGMLVGIVEMFFIYLQIRLERKANSSQLLLELLRDFDNQEMRKARKKLAHALKDEDGKVTDEIWEGKADKVVNFLDFLGLLTRKGILNIKEVDYTFGDFVLGYWECFKDYIKKKREGKNKFFVDNFT